MNRFKKLLWISLINVNKSLEDIRFLAAFFLLITFISMGLNGINSFTEAMGVRVNFLFPFFFEDSYEKVKYIIPLLILFINIGEITKNDYFLFIRLGKNDWIKGQIIFLFSMVVCYFITFYIISTIMVKTTFSNTWSTSIETLVKTNAKFEFSIVMNFPRVIYDYFLPYQALFFSMILNIIVSSLIGLIIMIFNLLRKKYIGFIIVSFLIILPRLIPTNTRLSYLSPFTWTSLSQLRIGYLNIRQPSFYFAISVSIFIIILLIIVAHKIINNTEIN